jgi:DNA-binding transcriptional MerR regulator
MAAPYLTKRNARYRGPRESEKHNLISQECYKDLRSIGVKIEEIKEVIATYDGNANKIRDYMTASPVSFSEFLEPFLSQPISDISGVNEIASAYMYLEIVKLQIYMVEKQIDEVVMSLTDNTE